MSSVPNDPTDETRPEPTSDQQREAREALERAFEAFVAAEPEAES
ncbi:MAG TPA: hypothetical protein VE953_16995 [Terriglobales bacterium]|nr:hypothetical protein [Terriglobales bacterium]